MAFLNKTGVERLWLHIVSQLGKKVDKVDGKDLSTNDYTTEEKEQLATLGTLVGDTTVSAQITNAVSAITPDSIGAVGTNDYYGLVEKEGAMISANSLDGAGIKATSYISATQEGSGTPSPDNVRPISGWDTVNLIRTGKNLLGFDDFAYAGSAYTDSCEQGAFTRTVTANHTTTYVVAAAALGNIKSTHLKAGTYMFTLTHQSSEKTFANPYLEVTLSDSTIVQLKSGVATTLAMDGTITGIRQTSTSYLSGDTITYTMQLEAGEAATDYEPYQGQTLTASLPETVYGGSLDWTTGTLTVTHHQYAITGAESWQSNGGTVYYIKDPAGAGDDATAATDTGYCTHYRYANAYTGKLPDTAQKRSSIIWIDDSRYTEDVAAMKAYLAEQYAAGTPVTLVYELATPYALQLTPQQLEALQGVNTVWSNCGDTRAIFNYSLCGNYGGEVSDPVAAREGLLMVVSATEPTSPETGMLWFDIS